LCSHLDRKIIDATEVACVHLTEGEILEIPLYAQTHSRASSLEIARKKTAALFKLAAFSAAYLADGSPEVSDNFSAFGESLGIAFQILDDILDVTSNEDLLGKPSGTDIRERKPALVNVLWLETSSERAKILLKKPTKNEDDFVRESVLELRASSVIDEARKIALGYTNAARQQLQSAMQKAKNPNFDVYAALESLIDYTIERVA